MRVIYHSDILNKSFKSKEECEQAESAFSNSPSPYEAKSLKEIEERWKNTFNLNGSVWAKLVRSYHLGVQIDIRCGNHYERKPLKDFPFIYEEYEKGRSLLIKRNDYAKKQKQHSALVRRKSRELIKKDPGIAEAREKIADISRKIKEKCAGYQRQAEKESGPMTEKFPSSEDIQEDIRNFLGISG